MKSGIHGHSLKIIPSAYRQLKARVRTDNGLTEWFKCVIGTRQGCMLSLLLFAPYLNAFIELLVSEMCRGIFVSECFTNVNILLYADDLVLCSDTGGGLLKQLEVLERYCSKWGGG